MARAPLQTDCPAIRGSRCGLIAATLWLSCLTALATNDSIEPAALPQLMELLWSLLFLVLFVLAAIIWVGLIRRNVRERTETIREREAALEEHYRELFENARDIIFTHDLEGNLTSLNKAGEDILGYARAEAAKLNLSRLLAPEYQEAFNKVVSQLKDGLADTHCELEMRAKNGRRVVLRTSLRMLHAEAKPGRIQGIAWDITEQKQAEEALRDSEQRLRRSLEERVRIGRDLHDGIIQSIYAIGLGLGDCRRMLKESPGDAEAKLAKAIVDLNMVIRDVRNFIVGLEPEALKGREFKTALESLVASMNESRSTRFSFDVDPHAADRLNASQATHLLQIAREVLSNSLRHARAKTTVVSLQTRNGGVHLEVRDDGVGFDQANLSGTGFGLRNIEARARELGARSDIASAPGKGTRVTIEIPDEMLYGPA
jgi:PAS domain S-box-containing protein